METLIPFGYAEHAPPSDLAGYVVCFWTGLEPRDSGSAPQSTRRVLPDGCVDIILGFGRGGADGVGELTEAFGVGAMTKPLVIEGSAPRLYVGVRFKPGYAFAGLGRPASELTDERVDFALLSNDEGRAVASVAEQVTNEARLAAMVELVRARLFGSTIIAGVPRSVRAAVRRIAIARGNVRVATLASEIGITRQQLAKQFAMHVGVPPKLFARISRTQAALARADAARVAYARDVDWGAIACDLGYYDQPHFIDDFKSITGQTPGEWRGSLVPEVGDGAISPQGALTADGRRSTADGRRSTADG